MTVPYYQTTGATGVDTVIALGPEGFLSAVSTHPHYAEIVAGLEAGDDSVLELFNVGAGITKKFRQVTERISWDGRNVLWDGDVMDSDDPFVSLLTRALETGESNYAALAKFKEKLESNPNEHSRKMAFEWLSSHDFRITEDGDVVAYKGVTSDGLSTRAGHAFVDGREYVNAQIPNEDGTVVSMPRSEVAHDPNAACHTGLHIGTWGFASTFTRQRTKRIHVSPRDFVSVPAHGYTKARVCRYTVVCDAEAEVVEGSPVLKDTEVKWTPDVGARV